MTSIPPPSPHAVTFTPERPKVYIQRTRGQPIRTTTALGAYIVIAGTSVKDVADATGVHKRYFSDWLAAKRPIPMWAAQRIAQYLDIDVEALYQPPPDNAPIRVTFEKRDHGDSESSTHGR